MIAVLRMEIGLSLRRLRCAVVGHAFGPPFGIGRALHVRCAECGSIGDGVLIERRVLKATPRAAKALARELFSEIR